MGPCAAAAARATVSAGVLCPSMADPVDLDDPHLRAAREAGESLLRVASLIQDAFVAATASESLSPLAARLLRAAVEPRPQRELGAQLGVDAARISLLTSELVERGLLTRTRGAGDQRVRRPVLTASGRETVRRIGQGLAARSPLVATLDERQLRSLLRLLERVERGTSSGGPIASPAEGE